MAIHPIVADIYQSGPECWTDDWPTDRQTLPSTLLALYSFTFAWWMVETHVEQLSEVLAANM